MSMIKSVCVWFKIELLIPCPALDGCAPIGSVQVVSDLSFLLAF